MTASIDHVTLRSSDLESSLRLFTRVFELLEFGGRRFDGGAFHEWNDFSIASADGDNPVTRRLHVGFAATSATRMRCSGSAKRRCQWATSSARAGSRSCGPAHSR